MLGHVQLYRARNLRAEPMLCHVSRGLNPGFPGHERGQNLVRIISNRGHNPQSSDDNTAHGNSYF
jgi:hypothetical protein